MNQSCLNGKGVGRAQWCFSDDSRNLLYYFLTVSIKMMRFKVHGNEKSDEQLLSKHISFQKTNFLSLEEAVNHLLLKHLFIFAISRHSIWRKRGKNTMWFGFCSKRRHFGSQYGKIDYFHGKNQIFSFNFSIISHCDESKERQHIKTCRFLRAQNNKSYTGKWKMLKRTSNDGNFPLYEENVVKTNESVGKSDKNPRNSGSKK